MRLLSAALIALGCGAHDPPPPAPPTLAGAVGAGAPSLGVLAAVGAAPRAYADLDLGMPQFQVQLASTLASLGDGVAAKCGIDPARLERVRIAVGEPLRIAAELDGAIDRRAVACALGDRASLLAGLAVVVADRPGGVSIEYRTDREHADAGRVRGAELRARCDASCAIARLGPTDHPVLVELHATVAVVRLRISGPRFGGAAATFVSAVQALAPTVPALSSLAARDDAGALVLEVRLANRDAGIAFALALREHLLTAFRIPSSSMEPTLHIGDQLIAVKGPLLGAYAPGDVLVYTNANGDDYVKRYVAGGGQTVTQTETGIELDGHPVPAVADGDFTARDEGPRGELVEHPGKRFRETLGAHSYATVRTGPARGVGHWLVPRGELFFVGDNRNNSNDSRFSGTIPAASVRARAAFLYWAMSEGAPDWERIGATIE